MTFNVMTFVRQLCVHGVRFEAEFSKRT
jgi:hypothetical protein